MRSLASSFFRPFIRQGGRQTDRQTDSQSATQPSQPVSHLVGERPAKMKKTTAEKIMKHVCSSNKPLFGRSAVSRQMGFQGALLFVGWIAGWSSGRNVPPSVSQSVCEPDRRSYLAASILHSDQCSDDRNLTRS